MFWGIVGKAWGLDISRLRFRVFPSWLKEYFVRDGFITSWLKLNALDMVNRRMQIVPMEYWLVTDSMVWCSTMKVLPNYINGHVIYQFEFLL